MARKTPKQIQNPRIGLYTVQFGTSKKQLTMSLAKSRFFRFVRGANSYGKWIESFQDAETANEKKGVLYRNIIIYHRIKEQEREARRLHYKTNRTQQNKRYAPRIYRRKTEAEILGISERRFKTIAAKYNIRATELQQIQSETEGAVTTVSQDNFSKRIKKLESFKRQVIKNIGTLGKQGAFLEKIFEVSSRGSPPASKKDKKENWADYQQDIGLKHEESIIWTITRYIRDVGKQHFMKLALAYLKKGRKELRFGIALTSNLKEHPNLLHTNQYVPLNLRDRKYLLSKQHWEKFQWKFIKLFMTALQQGDRQEHSLGERTSMEVFFQEEFTRNTSIGKIATLTPKFKVGFFVYLAEDL
jgi:hypothetical protein